MNIEIKTFPATLSQGKLLHRSDLPFLTSNEETHFSDLGFRKGEKAQEDYLNTLSKGTFKIERLRYDNGTFIAVILVIQATAK